MKVVVQCFCKLYTGKEEIAYITLPLNSNNACGPNSIVLQNITSAKNEFLKQLAAFFPFVLKTAKVVPFLKKDSKLDYSSYHPISLLSNIENFSQ